MGSLIKEHVGVVILAVFIVIAVFGPMYVMKSPSRQLFFRAGKGQGRTTAETDAANGFQTVCRIPIPAYGHPPRLLRIVGFYMCITMLTMSGFLHRGCILFTRRREYRKFHPSPKAFRQARAKLSTVAECRRDSEKGLGGGDPEWTENW
jgi:hypothetical protein